MGISDERLVRGIVIHDSNAQNACDETGNQQQSVWHRRFLLCPRHGVHRSKLKRMLRYMVNEAALIRIGTDGREPRSPVYTAPLLIV